MVEWCDQICNLKTNHCALWRIDDLVVVYIGKAMLSSKQEMWAVWVGIL